MCPSRFVVPRVVRYELSEGDWVEFKAELTYGERLRLSSRALGQRINMETRQVEYSPQLEAYSVEELFMWLTDWSLTDVKEEVVEISRESIGALRQDAADELRESLAKHLEAMEDEKNR